jgi:hypothetical protein
MPAIDMTGKTIARVSGMAIATTAPAHAEREETHGKDDDDRLPQRTGEVGDRIIDDRGLIGDQGVMDADRQIGGDPPHRRLEVAAKRQDVAAVAHRDGQADRRLAVDPEHRLRRIGKTALYLRHVAQPQDPAPGREIHVEHVLLGFEGTRDLQRDGFFASPQHSRGAHQVLRLQRRDQSVRIDAQARQLFERKVDVDHLVLGAEHVDLRDVGYFQQLRADVLHEIAQLAQREPVGSKAVNGAVGVAEFVVEERPDDPLRQCQPHVADLLAHVVPGVVDGAPLRAAEQIDKDHGAAGRRIAAQHVEMRHLLQCALEPLGHLQQRLVECGARPLRLHDHRPDCEYRVFRSPQLHEGESPGDNDHEHQVDDDRAVADRPLGKVEPAHDAAPSSLTFSPGRSDCTPAVTTMSPGSSPCPTIT